MSITVRRATAQDQPALQELFLKLRRQTYTWLPTASFCLADLQQQTQGEAILLAQNEQGALAGFISVWESDHFIHHLYVDAGQQRRGVGRTLLTALPGWPGQGYVLKCLLRNHAAAAFYRASGFTETGSGMGEDGEYIVFESGKGADPAR